MLYFISKKIERCHLTTDAKGTSKIDRQCHTTVKLCKIYSRLNGKCHRSDRLLFQDCFRIPSRLMTYILIWDSVTLSGVFMTRLYDHQPGHKHLYWCLLFSIYFWYRYLLLLPKQGSFLKLISNVVAMSGFTSGT